MSQITAIDNRKHGICRGDDNALCHPKMAKEKDAKSVGLQSGGMLHPSPTRRFSPQNVAPFLNHQLQFIAKAGEQ